MTISPQCACQLLPQIQHFTSYHLTYLIWRTKQQNWDNQIQQQSEASGKLLTLTADIGSRTPVFKIRGDVWLLCSQAQPCPVSWRKVSPTALSCCSGTTDWCSLSRFFRPQHWVLQSVIQPHCSSALSCSCAGTEMKIRSSVSFDSCTSLRQWPNLMWINLSVTGNV